MFLNAFSHPEYPKNNPDRYFQQTWSGHSWSKNDQLKKFHVKLDFSRNLEDFDRESLEKSAMDWVVSPNNVAIFQNWPYEFTLENDLQKELSNLKLLSLGRQSISKWAKMRYEKTWNREMKVGVKQSTKVDIFQKQIIFLEVKRFHLL